jgi:hypothetical protein
MVYDPVAGDEVTFNMNRAYLSPGYHDKVHSVLEDKDTFGH